jgi:GNAT superfamily N-acetyltransferase
MKIPELSIRYKIVPLNALLDKIPTLRKLSYADGEMWRILDNLERGTVKGSACLAHTGSEIVGWASKIIQGDGRPELNLYVKKSLRRRGIGKKMVKKLFPTGLSKVWYNPHDKTSDAFYSAIDV